MVLVGFDSRGGRVFYRNNGDRARNKKDEEIMNTIIYCNVVCWVKLVNHIDSWFTWIVLRLPLNPPCVDKGCICRMKKLWMMKKPLKRCVTTCEVKDAHILSCTSLCIVVPYLNQPKIKERGNFDVAASERVFWGLV